MKERKRLAVLMTNVSQRYQQLLLEGIQKQAFALDYDVAVFTPFMCHDTLSEYQRGENCIYSLPHYASFDAVLYAPCSFYNDNARAIVENSFRNCGRPVIALESDSEEWNGIMMDDRSAFECVTAHLIEIHGLRHILCLTGFEGNLQAERRAQGYRDAMEKHGLPVEDGWVIYGDFWTSAAEALAEEIASGKIERPEGVVCCCDKVALTLCNRLIELGVRVPQDILIMGYDAGDEAEENVPSLTTYIPPVSYMGVEGVLRAHQLITGQQAEPVMRDRGRLIPAESCGCGKDFLRKFEERQQEIHNTEEFRKLFEDVPMAEKLNSTTTLNELLEKIMDHFYLINGWRDWYLCLCDQWDDLSMNTGNSADYDHYTDRMHLRITCTDQVGRIVDEPFDLHDLLPALHEKCSRPRTFFFTPLHFNERCFGYAAIGLGERTVSFDALYHSWTRNLNNALEFMRIRNNMNSINQRLLASSMRDALTGIYNRQGFNQYAAETFARAQEIPGKMLLVIAADLDCLKVINDTYGHVEGDNAISIVANALNTCAECGEICARTGGDEFLVIGCAAYTEELAEEYICYIQRYLERYNAASGKPYRVEASIGYVLRQVTAEDLLQPILDEADSLMYANKVARKKNRE